MRRMILPAILLAVLIPLVGCSILKPTQDAKLSLVDYAEQVNELNQAPLAAVGRLHALAAEPEPRTDAWRQEVDVQAEQFREYQRALSGMASPDEAVDIHDDFLAGADHFCQAMDHLATGLDDDDEAEIDRSNELLLSGIDKTTGAFDRLLECMAAKRLASATATPTLDAESEIVVYADLVDTLSQGVLAAMDLLEELLQEPELASDAWRQEVAFYANVIRAYHSSLNDIEPPEDLAGIHADLVDGALDLSYAMDHLEEGLDTLEPTELDRYAELIYSGTHKAGDALGRLETVMAE